MTSHQPATHRLTLDRSLPVPLGTQLRGLIEYGIACGELVAGERLPSVRELAEALRVAPMTVSQVYRDLKAAGLIEARAGSGTFVAQAAGTGTALPDPRLGAFHRRLDAVLEDGLALGLGAGEIAGLVGARLQRLGRGARPARRHRLVLVGIFEAATAAYAEAVARHLGVVVEPTTVDALGADPALRSHVGSADLVLTLAYRRREVEALLPGRPVAAISFIPSEATRRALASLGPDARVLAVSRFPEFLPLMKPGVQRFAPHAGAVTAAVLDSEGLDALVAAHSVVVHATGCEALLARLPPGTLAIEYRHRPDPLSLDRVVRPLLEGQPLIDRQAS